MQNGHASRRRKAAQMLLLATVFWGLSFPVMKSLGMLQAKLIPGVSSWFVSSSALAIRFAVATLLVLCWSWRTLRQITKLELWQGLGLGLFGAAGLLFQMDGLAYTSASTSAFLTQCYCLFLPFIVAFRDRRRPSSMVLICSVMVITGVAILAKVDWHLLVMGRGEWETLVASLLFTGQILLLETPAFSRNRVDHFTVVMFAVTALVLLPIGLLTANQPSDWITAYASWAAIGFMAALVVCCTMVAYILMNYWQRFVPATEAGLIYAVEPVSASLFALFLPSWFSTWAGLDYANETITMNLLLGGGLISGANVLIQLSAREPVHAGAAASAQSRVNETKGGE